MSFESFVHEFSLISPPGTDPPLPTPFFLSNLDSLSIWQNHSLTLPHPSTLFFFRFGFFVKLSKHSHLLSSSSPPRRTLPSSSIFFVVFVFADLDSYLKKSLPPSPPPSITPTQNIFFFQRFGIFAKKNYPPPQPKTFLFSDLDCFNLSKILLVLPSISHLILLKDFI